MKDKLLQIRMSEKEVEDLKLFTEQIGFKSVSDTVRESLKAFIVIKEREPEGDDFTKYNDSSAILHSINIINNNIDVSDYMVNLLEYFQNGFTVDESLQAKNIELYDSGIYETLKEMVLKSVYHDLLFNRKIDDNISKLIKSIVIESIKK